MPPDELQARIPPVDLDAVYAAARAHDPDRFAAALLAPRTVRDDLVALAAFSGEVGKIPLDVREPHMGEIRLQWWRDALSEGIEGARSGNPVADAFAAVMRAHGIAFDLVSDHLDALAHALFADAAPDEAALELEFWLREGVLFEIAARILGQDAGEHAEVLKAAACAYGAARLGLALPHELARGRVPLAGSLESEPGPAKTDARHALAAAIRIARMHLAQLRPQFRKTNAQLRLAILPAALVEPYLTALEKRDHDPARDLTGIAPLTRMLRLGSAYWRGRL